MKINLIVIFCLILLFQCDIKAQDFNNYSRMESSGQIPADFITLSEKKYEQQKQQISSKSSHHEKKVEEQFYLESSFDLDDLLLSGDVIFNDPISEYLNQIKDTLLKGDPLTRDSIHIYLLRSTEVNAFTTNNGIVFVTVGLVAQVENEAQLAFVLSHEFQHFKHKDALQEVIENDKIKRGKDLYRHLSFNDAELKKFQYSKDIETRADLDGLELYKKSNYSLDEAKEVFTVLEYSDLPFDDVAFKKSYFESGKYIFPDNYFLKETAVIPDDQNYDDSKSTHPNIKKRKDSILYKMGSYINTGRKKFIIKSEEDFDKIQKNCRYETCLIQLSNSEYEEAFYSSYLLLLNDSTNKFLQKVMAKALYGISEYKTSHCYSLIHTSYKDIYGSSQQIYYFFDKMPAHEMAVLALRYNLKVLQKYPDDSELYHMSDDLFNDLSDTYDNKSTDFYNAEELKTLQNDSPADTTHSDSHSSKYDKIKKMQATKGYSTSDYYKYAFADLLANTQLEDQFKNEFTKYDKSALDKTKEALERMRKNHEIYSKGYALGISNILIIDPFYLKFDERKHASIKYIASEEAQRHILGVFNENAAKLGINTTIVSSKNISSTDLQTFNDLSVFNEWISEKLQHMNDNVDMQTSTTADLERIASHYGCDKFLYTGVVTVREKNNGVPIFITSLVIYPFLPYGIYSLIKSNQYTSFYALVIDASTGKIIMNYSNEINMQDNAGVLNSNIYYTLQQIKNIR